MKHIIAYSGGKDSTALLCWAEKNLPEYTAVFCDTHWEHGSTYQYVSEINAKLLNGRLVTVSSEKYKDGMRSLVQLKGRVPSAKARFCTENLKVNPMKDWLRSQTDEYTLYQGIRSNESFSRSQMKAREWSDIYDCWVERPLFDWTAEQVFALIKESGLDPTPLYLRGAGRIGCFPCVLINQRELKAFLADPELRGEVSGRILELEQLCGRTFFPPNYIPVRFHTGFDEVSGKSFCWAKDVFSYIESVDENQLPLMEARSCMSVYNLCE